MTLTAEETSLDEELDFPTICEGRPKHEECDKIATRWQRLSCGCPRLACDHHADLRIKHGLTRAGIWCRTCDQMGVYVVLDEPL